MSGKRIGSFSGSGSVELNGEVLSAADYHLEIYQDFIQGQMMEGSYNIPGGKRIEGTVRGKGLPMGEKLTLVTREGYKLEFFMESSYGTIAATGPLLNLEGKAVV